MMLSVGPLIKVQSHTRKKRSYHSLSERWNTSFMHAEEIYTEQHFEALCYHTQPIKLESIFILHHWTP